MSKVKKKDGYIRIGTVVAAHGIKGEVKVKAFTEDPYAFLDYGDPELFDGTVVPFEGFRQGPKGLLLATIEGVNDRNVAETWKGKDFYLPLDALPEPEEEDAAYFGELQGMQVLDEAGTLLGKIIDLYDTGANAVLVVRPAEDVHPQNKDFLLPYIDDVVVRLDRDQKQLIVADISEYLAL